MERLAYLALWLEDRADVTLIFFSAFLTFLLQVCFHTFTMLNRNKLYLELKDLQ